MVVTIDSAAPVAPTIGSFSTDSGTLGDHVTSDNTPTLTGTAEANSAIKIYDGAIMLGSVTADGTGAWSYTATGLADGVHSLSATATDAAGNTGTASGALSLTVDTVAPGAPTIGSFSPDTGTAGDGITIANDLVLTGAAEANSTVKVYDGATLLGSTLVNSSGAWSFDTGTLGNGTHSFTATATDAAGNVGTGSSDLDVTVDTSQAAIPVTTTSFITGLRGLGLLSGTSDPNSAISIYDGNTGALLGKGGTGSAGTWSVLMGNMSNSVHSFTAAATDAAGHVGFAHVIYGTTGNDTITAGPTNETIFGGGGSDTFVFTGNTGKDTIADFQATTDVLQLSHNAFANFADVLAHASQAGSDVVVAVDASNSVTLHNTVISQLTNNNVHLV
jgi:hypothetical protein